MHTETVEYSDGDVRMLGYVVYDEEQIGKRPGILVAHDAFGLNDYAKRRAVMLAELGYVAFAADMYGQGAVAKSEAEMLALYGGLADDAEKQRRRMGAALRQLAEMPQVQQGKLAAIGYCLGGAAALELARDGADIKGAVSFHGALATRHPEDAQRIKGKVLVCHGAEDALVPLKDTESFMTEMRAANVDWQLHIYGGVRHAFTIPWIDALHSPVVKYDRQADVRSWSALQAFLGEIFEDLP